MTYTVLSGTLNSSIPYHSWFILLMLHCFNLYLCCLLAAPTWYFPTVMARYSLFVPTVPLSPKQTNKQIFVIVLKYRQRIQNRSDFKKYRPVYRKTDIDLKYPHRPMTSREYSRVSSTLLAKCTFLLLEYSLNYISGVKCSGSSDLSRPPRGL